MTDPLLLTEEQAAARLLVNPRTLRKLRQAGAIRYVALTGRRIAYRPEDCMAYVESRTRQEQSAPPRSRKQRVAGNHRHGNIIPFSARQELRG